MQSSKRKKASASLSDRLPPRLFRALGDPSRAALFARLAQAGGPCTVGQLAEHAGVDLSVVSRHLGRLREAGAIECVKRGKQVWCSVPASALASALRALADALECCCPAPEPPPAPRPRVRPKGAKR